MDSVKSLRPKDLLNYSDNNGNVVGTVEVLKVYEDQNRADVLLNKEEQINVSAQELLPIPANNGEIWEKNGFLGFAKVSDGNTMAYIEVIGPKVSPVPVIVPRTIMVVLGNIVTYIVFNDKTNPNLPAGRQRLMPYTYLHEIQHLYQDYGYLKNWDF